MFCAVLSLDSFLVFLFFSSFIPFFVFLVVGVVLKGIIILLIYPESPSADYPLLDDYNSILCFYLSIFFFVLIKSQYSTIGFVTATSQRRHLYGEKLIALWNSIRIKLIKWFLFSSINVKNIWYNIINKNGSWILVYSYNELQQWKNAQHKKKKKKTLNEKIEI